MMVRVSAEDDARFERELPLSLKAVEAIKAHLELSNYVVKIICNKTYIDRDAYDDRAGDIEFHSPYNDEKFIGEVKGRSLEFTCAEDFPFLTIIVDRANKTVPLSSHYFTLNPPLTHTAIIPLSSKPFWRTEIVTDHKRGYDRVPVFMCPKEHAKFVMLLRYQEKDQPSGAI